MFSPLGTIRLTCELAWANFVEENLFCSEGCFCWRTSHTFLIFAHGLLPSLYALCRFGVWVNRALAASCGHHESFYITGLLRIFLVTEKICSNKNSWALLAIPPVSGTVGIIHLQECGRSLTPLLYILKYLPSFANKVTASPFLRDNFCCMHVVLKLPLNNFFTCIF